ncbi:MAG: hypothetical protein HQL23_08930 [Candidatus Omnitrophica bacterium]|nr:hypothetical protein [Candidatus Omnitrophota bacterium]
MQCDCGKKLLAAGAVFVFKMFAGVTLCGGVFSWVYRLPPTNVWRPMEPSARLFVGMCLASLLFVAGYQLVSQAFAGMRIIQKGLVYGLCIWAAGIVPGMIATYTFMTVNTTVIVYWTLSMLVLVPLQGVIVASILRENNAGCCLHKPNAVQ